MNFDRAVAFILKEEGGLVDNSLDPGGLTNHGISKRAYPNLDIRNLTIDQAKAIYKMDYWDKLGVDQRPYGEALCVFDCAVNQGVSRALQILQKTSGPFVVSYQAERALYYASLSTFSSFGRGWMRRLFRVTVEAST